MDCECCARREGDPHMSHCPLSRVTPHAYDRIIKATDGLTESQRAALLSFMSGAILGSPEQISKSELIEALETGSELVRAVGG